MIKATTFLITMSVNAAVGAAMFFMLILSLNGFTGKQAEPGLILFFVWVLITSFVVGVLSILSVNYLAGTKPFNQWLAATISVSVCVIGGAAINFVGATAAVLLTLAMR